MSPSWRTSGRLRQALAVYVLTDDTVAKGRSVLGMVRAALAGGVTAVQLRSKARTARELVDVGCALAQACAEYGALFVINDRVDVALACGADGVHLGQDDLPCAAARGIGGPDLIIGVSAATEAEARAALMDGADYIGTGAVFATRTKSDAGAPIGPEGLCRVVRAVPLPVVAIGGLHADNAGAALAVGAAGVATISAVMGAEDVTRAAARLAAAVGRTPATGPDRS